MLISEIAGAAGVGREDGLVYGRERARKMAFELDPRLAADTFAIGDLSLSRALLMNDARFPWAILVPRRPALIEIADLVSADRAVLVEEIAQVSEALRAEAGVQKINVGALGNIVRQLHVHIVGRSVGDPAWPGPVWGTGPGRPYETTQRDAALARLRSQLAEAIVAAPALP